LARVRAEPVPGLEKEIIVVDDCSNDGTRDLLAKEAEAGQRVLYHDVNRGKGAAIRHRPGRGDRDIILIQDADLEYDPSDYATLLKPILDGDADVVYGSRFKGGPARSAFFTTGTASETTC